MEMFNPHVYFPVLAILLGACGYWIGWRHPGGTGSFRWAAFWAGVDVVWIMLALFAVLNIVSSTEGILARASQRTEIAIRDNNRADVLSYVSRAQGALCTTGTQGNDALCNTLREFRDALIMPNFDTFHANRFVQNVKNTCDGGVCPAPVTAIVRHVENYLPSFRLRDDTYQRELETFKYTSFNLAGLMLAFGLRMGRSGAEAKKLFLKQPNKGIPANSDRLQASDNA